MVSSEDGTTIYNIPFCYLPSGKGQIHWERVERTCKSRISKKINWKSAAWVTEWMDGDINSVPAHQVIKFALAFSPLHPILSKS